MLFRSDASSASPKPAIEVHGNKKSSDASFAVQLADIASRPLHTEAQRNLVFSELKNGMPIRMSRESAVKTLEILNGIFGKIEAMVDEKERSKWDFASIVAQPQFAKLPGMVNNCLETLGRESISLRDIIKSQAQEFQQIKPLFAKLEKAGLLPRLKSE
mgnify:CR=1 FL=1